MFARLSLLTRLLLIFAIAFAVTLPSRTFTSIATANARGDDDDDDDDDDDGDDDDGDDDDDDDGDDDDDDDDDPQPPVTAGGMFTKKTYPIAELERPLTITKGILEVQAGIDIDVGAQTAFEFWRANLEARYGLADHIEAQGQFNINLTSEGVAPLSFFTFGIEAALAYDLVDFRLTIEMPLDPFQFDFSFGFPFRYKPQEKVAIIALDKLMTIHTHDDLKPDLTIGIGLIYQVIPNLAAFGRGEVIIAQFDPDFIAIPFTAGVQFTPKYNLDIGGEFTFGNLKAADPVSPFDSRSLLLFGQLRI